MENLIKRVVVTASLLLSVMVFAAPDVGPRGVVVGVVDALKIAVDQYDETTDPDGSVLLANMKVILEPIVDFGFIARVVMGDTAKTATAEQLKQFENVFRLGLVSTYAKGMTGYVQAEMTIPELGDETENQNRVAVRQEIKTSSGVQIIDYTMAKNRTTGEWKLINVVLNGINLGKTFRSQFAQALKQYNGNVDKVIQSWGQELLAKS